MKKLFMFGFFLALLFACVSKEKYSEKDAAQDEGSMVYKKYCILCHGADGKLGLNGSKDLTISQLTKAERVELIKHGKNAMTPFESILSEEEINAVADYTMTMKK